MWVPNTALTITPCVHVFPISPHFSSSKRAFFGFFNEQCIRHGLAPIYCKKERKISRNALRNMLLWPQRLTRLTTLSLLHITSINGSLQIDCCNPIGHLELPFVS